ncbi:MAG: ATP-binding protein [Elusimicrobiota bacterium]|jgi:hypothetical protein
MIPRPFWRARIESAWAEAPIVWLSGVRRSGKTTLARSFGPDRALYVNCDLPSAKDMVSDPVLFYRGCRKEIVVFDEVHQLQDPSTLLKIGADEFPKLKILATGSSTLAASRKFRDTLTGRKRQLTLLPVLWSELEAFGKAPLQKRLLHGGLPAALLADRKNDSLYREWADSFFSRDIQLLFGFRDYAKFNLFFEYLMKQSGGLFEAAKVSGSLGINRATVASHLRALELTNAMAVLRPFHGGGRKEIVKTPKVYGFDTGFAAFFKGWDPLRHDDLGVLWEHLVLEGLQAAAPARGIHFWRDTSGREVDFVLPRGRDSVDAVECKWDPRQFDPANLAAFRALYPRGRNFLVSPSASKPYAKRVKGLEIGVCDPAGITNGK